MSGWLLFAEVMLIWAVATAGDGDREGGVRDAHASGLLPVLGPRSRAAIAAVLASLALWEPDLTGLAFAALVWSGVAGVFAARRWAVRRERVAEIEIGGLTIFGVLMGVVISWWELGVGFPYLRVPLSSERLVVLHLTAVGFVIAVWHAGNVVRGILQKSHVLPDASAAADEQRLRHGRLIGYLERLLLVALVVRGSLEGLGFLIAAKGLIRARDFGDRSMAEYFLIGSLSSIAAALAIGLGIQALWGQLW